MDSLDVSDEKLAPLQACVDETKRDSARALECSAESHSNFFCALLKIQITWIPPMSLMRSLLHCKLLLIKLEGLLPIACSQAAFVQPTNLYLFNSDHKSPMIFPVVGLPRLRLHVCGPFQTSGPAPPSARGVHPWVQRA